jgi:hypothetical protein
MGASANHGKVGALMKKPTDSYGPAASQEAVRQRLAELEQDTIRATPQQITAVVVITYNADA